MTAQADKGLLVGPRGYRCPTLGKITQLQHLLLVLRRRPGLIGPQPHLDEVGRGRINLRIDAIGVVALGVDDARTSARPLHYPAVDHATITVGILVYHRAGQHPSHDLDVAMGVLRIAGAAGQQVVVAGQQRAVRNVGRIVVFTEREAVPSEPPWGSGREAIPGEA